MGVTTQTNCPGQGRGRAAVMPPLTILEHPGVVYLWWYNTHATVRKYDTLTGENHDLFTTHSGNANVTANVSPDGHWIIINELTDAGVTAIELVNVNGSYKQTVYCSQRNSSLSGVLLSPDQHSLIFNEQNQHKQTDTLNILDMTTGKVRTVLSSLQPGYPGAPAPQQAVGGTPAQASSQQPAVEPRYASQFMPQPGLPPMKMYIPLKWISNSSLYLMGTSMLPSSAQCPKISTNYSISTSLSLNSIRM
ncbi:hypothetical protein [Dictyobacter vulcani]|nr:hypothetical protein [Dictyobacter vulcani]